MNVIQKILSSIHRDRPAERPRIGQLLQPRVEDSFRDYPADGMSPSELATLLRSADSGILADAMELFEQMEEKDAHLYSVANTRRLALTGLDWQVISAAELRQGVDQHLADEAADYARESLSSLDHLDEILQHLSLALGRNIAVAEIIWDEVDGVHRVVDVLPVDFTRIIFDELDQPRILTQDEPFDGIELPPNKFIVHTPHSVSGHPTRGGLMRVTAFAFLAKNFAMKDWLIFAEVFGMPVRVARYEPSATPEEKRELLYMLQSLGTDASAIFSKAVELNFLEANRGTPPPPYESISEFMNREMSKAWLGQTLTTDVTGASGTFAAAVVHNEVRHDLREDDIHKEGRTLRRDLLRPLCQLKFGHDVPVPFFRRKLNQPRDLRELADILSVAVNELSIRVPRRWAHDALGIPAPMEDQEVLAPAGGESEESFTNK